jgi:hypothetical protein
MWSIVVKRITLAALMTMIGATAQSAELPFRVLQDPVLGLRYEAARARFEPLPQDVFSLCSALLVNQHTTGRYWIFGKANDAARTYYVIGGYSENLHPEPGYPRYQKDELGAVVYVQSGECRAIDPAREVFDTRDFDETPQVVLRQLADDFVARLLRAFGGTNQLRAELRNQRVDQAQLPTELSAALAPYFAK